MITSYKLVSTGGVLRLSDGIVTAFIPADPANTDWTGFQLWQGQGGVPLPADPPPGLTQDELDSIAARQYQKLTALAGLSPAQIQTWVAANVTNLAGAQDAILTLAIGMSVLARHYIIEAKI